VVTELKRKLVKKEKKRKKREKKLQGENGSAEVRDKERDARLI